MDMDGRWNMETETVGQTLELEAAGGGPADVSGWARGKARPC